MSRTVLTADECEMWAQDASETSGMCEPGHCALLLRHAEAYRLAARALRAKEWLRLEAEAAGYAQETATTDADAWRSEGRETMAAEALAILEGREP